jgi:hypothetical protein
MQSIAVSRITSRLAAIAAGSTVAVLAATGVAQANPAYKYVKPYQQAAALAPNITDIEAVFTSTQPSSDPMNPFSGTRGIASYGDAIMSSLGTGLVPAVDASQVFSDRRYPGNAPFNAGEADNTGVEIGVNNVSKTITISLVLDSFGNRGVTLSNPRVADGMLLADGPGAGAGSPNALFAFALNEVNIPG